MERKTIASQLEFLAKLLRNNGWGEHYVQACEEAAALIGEGSER